MVVKGMGKSTLRIDEIGRLNIILYMVQVDILIQILCFLILSKPGKIKPFMLEMLDEIL